MLATFLSSALAAGIGAFAGAMSAYFLSLHKEKDLKKKQYLCLLMLIHEQLDSLHSVFSNVPEELIRESDGGKVILFDLPLPEISITAEQMQLLFEVSPDKQMPSTLIQAQHFLKAHAHKVNLYGINYLSLEFVQQQVRQLEFMLLSVRTQYEQATNDAFPLDY